MLKFYFFLGKTRETWRNFARERNQKEIIIFRWSGTWVYLPPIRYNYVVTMRNVQTVTATAVRIVEKHTVPTVIDHN